MHGPGYVLEVDRHPRQVVVRHRVGDGREGAPPEPRAREQPRHGERVEIVAREVGDQGEHADRLLGARSEREHAAVDLDTHRHAVHPAAHEAPLRHDPVERVDVAPERGERVVVPVDQEASDDRRADRDGRAAGAGDGHLGVAERWWGRVLFQVGE